MGPDWTDKGSDSRVPPHLRKLVHKFISLFEDLLEFSWVEDSETVQLSALPSGILDVFESKINEESLGKASLKDQGSSLEWLHPCLTFSGEVFDQTRCISIANARHEDICALAPGVILKIEWLNLVSKVSQRLFGDLHSSLDCIRARDESAFLEDSNLDGRLVLGLHQLEVIFFPGEWCRQWIILVYFWV